MRTIHLLQDVRGAWFVRTTSGGDKIHSNESYSTPAAGARAFLSEGDNQPFAAMVVHQPGRVKPVRVRRGRPIEQVPAMAVDKVAVRAAMKPAT